jgi:hypothetical protein
MHKSITRTQEKAFIVIIFVEMNGKSERESELAILMHQLSDVCSLSHSLWVSGTMELAAPPPPWRPSPQNAT